MEFFKLAGGGLVLIPSEAGLWLNNKRDIYIYINTVLIPSEAGLWLNSCG